MTGFTTKKISNINTLGERLEKHRKEKGLSIEKASRAINTNVRYLKDIEKDNYKALPADVYIINILKSYADLLDLNPSTVVDIFKKEKAVYLIMQKRKQQDKITKIGLATNALLNPRFIKYSAIIIVLFGMIAYIGWGVNRIIAPPRLIIDSPADNLVVNSHEINIQGSTEKEVSLKINDRPLLCDADGRFSLTLDLQNGLNTIKISAVKKHSKEQVVYRNIMVNDNVQDNNSTKQ
ncbi:MAG: helix-turn-helix domain-containing protein [Parcubacteria group bacterium]